MEELELTPAQKKLLFLFNSNQAEDYYEALKKVHFLGTYCIPSDEAELFASGQVHELLDIIYEVIIEHKLMEDRL